MAKKAEVKKPVMEQKALSASGLHVALSNAIRGIELGSMQPAEANSVSKAASQIINLARLQLQYHAQGFASGPLLLANTKP